MESSTTSLAEPRRTTKHRSLQCTRRPGSPAGQIFHAAGPSDGGWTIVAVHESQQSWESFRDDILMPRLQAGISGGFASPPNETVFDVASLVSQG